MTQRPDDKTLPANGLAAAPRRPAGVTIRAQVGQFYEGAEVVKRAFKDGADRPV